MAGSAFIEVETDFEYVQGELNEKTARFLMDFYHVQGDLEYTLKELANMMQETALEYLELNGISKSSNLGQGIHARVRGSAIELRSTAYRLPLWCKKDFGGHHIGMRRIQGEYPKEKFGTTRSSTHIGWSATQSANAMIMPQEVDWVGATGGHYSLRAVPLYTIHKAGDEIRKEKTGHDSHLRRYQSTRNVQYYGAHVEFGHKTRDGGGIGFVQARPHLRPALRTVADASTGILSQTMASMLYGLGSSFDTIKHRGKSVQGLFFGNHDISQEAINKYVGKMGAPHRLTQLRKSYSQRNFLQYGKKVNYYRYGYDEDTVRISRSQQRISKVFNPEHNQPSTGAVKASDVRRVEHRSGRYKYPSTLVSKPKKTVTKSKQVAKSNVRKTRSDKGKKRTHYAGKPVRSRNEDHRARARRKIDTQIYGKTRKKNIPQNRHGKDKTRLTQPHDFDSPKNRNYVKKPNKKYLEQGYVSKKDFADWEAKYEKYWDGLVSASRNHNRLFEEGLDDIMERKGG